MPASFSLLATALSSALLAGILLTLGAALRRPLADRYGASEATMRLSCRPSSHALHEPSIVLRRVDANRALFDHRDLNPGPHFQYAELLELFQFLQL